MKTLVILLFLGMTGNQPMDKVQDPYSWTCYQQGDRIVCDPISEQEPED